MTGNVASGDSNLYIPPIIEFNLTNVIEFIPLVGNRQVIQWNITKNESEIGGSISFFNLKSMFFFSLETMHFLYKTDQS